MEVKGILMRNYQDNSHRQLKTGSGSDFEKQMESFQGISKANETVSVNELIERMDGTHKVPYSERSRDGMIAYNGVIFVCDETRNRLCLGDMNDTGNCISISLSGGGSLVVNRDNIDELAKAIRMFSPEDINRILEAIAQDAKLRQTQNELEEEQEGIAAEDNKEVKEKKIRELLKEPSFQIGASTFTLKEWSNFLEKYDKTQERMREEMREEIEKRKNKAELLPRLGED